MSVLSRVGPDRMDEGVIFKEEQRVRQWWIWGMACTIPGKWGLLITYPKEERVIIGTLRPGELEAAVALVRKKG